MSAAEFERKLTEYKAEWESGDNGSLIRAYLLCAENSLQFPYWLRRTVLSELLHCYETRVRGKKGTMTAATRDAHADLHNTRHGLVASFLQIQEIEVRADVRKRINKRQAGRDAFAVLHPGTEASEREVEQMLESYDRIEKQGKISE